MDLRELACKNGDVELFRDLIDFPDYNYYMHIGARFGNIEIVECCVDRGANDWNWGLVSACYGGHKEIAELMIEYGATNFTESLQICENLEVIKLLVSKTAKIKGWTICMENAASNGDLEIVEYFINRGVRSLDTALLNACRHGHLEVAKLLVKNGATLLEACVSRINH